MKKLFSIIAIATFLFTSCTKVIELDLNSSDPQIVIEGNIGTTGDSALIKITKSVNFDDSNNFPLVQNAIVTVSDDAGNSAILVESSPGNYSSSTFWGVVGRTYYLNVSSEGKTFTAQSVIPIQVNFDSLMVEKITSTGGGHGGGQGSGTSYKVTVQYADPSNQTNYYRFLEYHNGESQGNIFVFDDRLTNGQSVSVDLISFNRKLNSGDTLTIEMQCIDKPVYEYFHSFGNLFGGPQNASTPANPYTNIIGSKLGYFSAHTTQQRKFVIQ
jgi:Domain of unknown function (DUF4249)